MLQELRNDRLGVGSDCRVFLPAVLLLSACGESRGVGGELTRQEKPAVAHSTRAAEPWSARHATLRRRPVVIASGHVHV